MPLRRYIFNTVTVVSLLLMLATVCGLIWEYMDYLAWQEWYAIDPLPDVYMSPPGPVHFTMPVLLSILPFVWLFRWRKRRSLPDNPCPSCGYDLTANTTGECPECGEAIGTEATEA